MSLVDKFTLIVPTYNRPALLNGLLDYFHSREATFEIFILDSSSAEFKSLNREVIQRYRLHTRHVEFNEATPFLKKINLQMSAVQTKYVSLCADDNLVLIDAIKRLVETLDATPDAIACHGLGLELILSGRTARLNIDNYSLSIDADDPIERMYQVLKDFHNTIYATYRTGHFRSVLIESEKFIERPFHWELFVVLAALAGGKVVRVDCPSNVRRSFLPAVQTPWHPVPLITNDPDGFIEDFIYYRDELLRFYSSYGITIGSEQKRLITQAHLVYVANEMRGGDLLRQLVAAEFKKYSAQQTAG